MIDMLSNMLKRESRNLNISTSMLEIVAIRPLPGRFSKLSTETGGRSFPEL